MKKTFALFAKKALVYTLTAAMLVSTPITAGAEEVEPSVEEVVVEPTDEATEPVEEVTEPVEEVVEPTEPSEDVDVPSDEATEVVEDEDVPEVVEEEDYSDAFDDFEKTTFPYDPVDGSGTDTISETSTDTHTGIYKANESEILGMSFDRSKINMTVDDKNEPVRVSIMYSSNLSASASEEINKILTKKIRWHVYQKGSFDPVTGKGQTWLDTMGSDDKSSTDLAQPLGISTRLDANGKSIQDVVYLNARIGCEATLVADISYRAADQDVPVVENFEYWDTYHNETRTVTLKYPEDGYMCAYADVFVKEYAYNLNVSVEDVAPVADGSYTVYPKIPYQMTAERVPATANDSISWYVDNTAIATINAKTGLLTPKKEGTVNVTAATERGVTKTVKVVVAKNEKTASKVDIYLNSVAEANKLTKTTKAWDISYTGGDATNGAKLTGDPFADTITLAAETDGTHEKITWSVNNAKVVRLAGNNKSCTVTIVGVGKATITAKTSNGKKASFTLDAKASLIKLVTTDVTMYQGQSRQLSVARVPAINADKLTFSVSKNDFLTVTASGMAKVGSKKLATTDGAVIPVKIKQGTGSKATDRPEEIKVAVRRTNVEGIVIERKIANYTAEALKKNGNDTLFAGRTGVYTVKTTPTAGMGQTLSWKASGKAVSVSAPKADGTVEIKALKKGSSNITVTGLKWDGSKKRYSPVTLKFKLTVKQNATSVTLKKADIVVNPVSKDKKISIAAVLGPNGSEKGIVLSPLSTSGNKDAFTIDEPTARANNTQKITQTKGAKAGDAISYKATAKIGGAAVVGNIYVKAKTAGVVISDKPAADKKVETLNKNTLTLTYAPGVDNSKVIYPSIKVKNGRAVEYYAPGGEYEDIVSWSVNKAGYVNVVQDNKTKQLKVYPLQVLKKGTVTITVKTMSGQKGTLKVEIKNPPEAS